ncbi:MAG: tetratricopeptide repeat protein [Rudaea sp.]
MVAALTGGVVSTAWQARRAAAERDLYEAEAERSDAILDYVSSMFEAASNAAGSAPVAAKDVLADSAAHLEERFSHQPADYARVVEFIGGIYSNFEDEQGAVAMEQRFLASPTAADYPDVAAHVRVWLAQSLLRQGDLDAAESTLEPAQAYWRLDAQRNRRELAKSLIIHGQLQKAHGDVDGALVTLRSALPDAVGNDGRDTEDSSNIKNSIALALMAQGAFDEADKLMADVRAYRERDGRGDDGLLMAIQNQGAIATARGDYPRAIELLQQSINGRRERFGPSGALAAAELNLAKAQVRSGHPDAALPVLDEAQAMAVQFTGDHSPIVLGVMQTRAEAQLARNDAAAAAPWVQQSLDAVRARGGEKHPLYPMAMALQAQLQSMQRHRDEARVSIDAAMHALDALGKGAALSRPQVERIQKTVLSTD